MGKRASKGGMEMDTFSRWRRLLGIDRNPGTANAVKTAARRRERRQARQQRYED